MKLCLPLSLLALLPAAAHAAEDPAVTVVDVSSAADIQNNRDNDARFYMQADVEAVDVRSAADYQFWQGNGHILTLKANVSQSAGGAVSFKEHIVDYGPELDDWKEYATTFTGFKKLTISNNQVIRPQDEAECIGSLPVEYNGGGIYGQLAGNLEITGNTDVNISGNSAECGGGIAVRSEGDSGSIHLGVLTLTNNGSVLFDGNRASKSGGALYNTAISLTGTTGGGHAGKLSFTGNTAGESGGAVYVQCTGFGSVDYVRIKKYDEVTFSGNSAKRGGGAIYAGDLDGSGKVEIQDNDTVTFDHNSVADFGGGGAIMGAKVDISNNKEVLFSANTNTSGTDGGAISAGELTMNGNESLKFTDNMGLFQGLAVFVDSKLTMKDNGTVEFSGNYYGNNSSFGNGALYVDGNATITGNDRVLFTDNKAKVDAAGLGVKQSLNLSGNGVVRFEGNQSSEFGAALKVHGSGSFLMEGNESVTFRGNVTREAKTGKTYLSGLNVLGSRDAEESLSASAGQTIVFYDSALLYYCVDMTFNKDHAAGSIIFSGLYAAEDLAKVKENYTEEELRLSRTSRITKPVTLGGGTLSVEDNAAVVLNGLTVQNGATFNLRNGSVSNEFSGAMDNSTIVLQSGGTMALAGSNSIKATAVNLQNGSTLSFTLPETGYAPLLTLDTKLTQEGELNIAVDKALNEDTVLFSLKDGSMPEGLDYGKLNLSVAGEKASSSQLYWQNGSLYYSNETMLGWVGGESMVWAENDDKNWAYSGDHTPRTYRNNALLYIAGVQGAMELQGELTPASLTVNVEQGKTLTFTGSGSIAGSTFLQLGGGGTLVVDCANTYTGGTTVNGTLRLTQNGSLGTGKVLLEGGTLQIESADCAMGELTLDYGHVELGQDAGLRVSSLVTVEGASSFTGSALGGSRIIADALELHRPGGVAAPGMVDCLGVAQESVSTGSGFLVSPNTYAWVQVFDMKEGATLDLSNITLTHQKAPADAVFHYNAETGEFTTGVYDSTALNLYVLRQDHDGTDGRSYAKILEASKDSFAAPKLEEIDFRNAEQLSLLVDAAVDRSVTFNLSNGCTAATLLMQSDAGSLHIGSLKGAGQYLITGTGGTIYLDEGDVFRSNTTLDDSWQGNLVLNSSVANTVLTLDKPAPSFASLRVNAGSLTLNLKEGATLTTASIDTNGGSVSINGGNLKAADTTVSVLSGDAPLLLRNLSVSAKTIAGLGRDASLLDGFKIESTADLMIRNMTITSNNEIYVGENTITLKDVTIKISADLVSLAEGIYTIDLKSLINCNLNLENVLLDASDFTLSEDFDPAGKSVVFDFGDDVSIMQATGLDMRMGNYWSLSVDTTPQGQVVFTKLVETPEPTTGTLGLLALAALAARRRK